MSTKNSNKTYLYAVYVDHNEKKNEFNNCQTLVWDYLERGKYKFIEFA